MIDLLWRTFVKPVSQNLMYWSILRRPTMKLEHCPFCGNTNITGATHKPVANAEFYEILCVECGARIRQSSKRKAIEAWNRRVSK